MRKIIKFLIKCILFLCWCICIIPYTVLISIMTLLIIGAAWSCDDAENFKDTFIHEWKEGMELFSLKMLIGKSDN